MPRPLNATKEASAKRNAEVMRLRLAGLSPRETAKETGLSVSRVGAISRIELAKTDMATRETAHELREMTILRLEHQYSLNYTIAMKGLGLMPLRMVWVVEKGKRVQIEEDRPSRVDVSMALERLRKLALDIAHVGGALAPNVITNTQINVGSVGSMTFQQIIAEAQAQGMVAEPPRNPDVKVLEAITEENFPRGEEVDFSLRNADIQSTGELGETARTGDPYANHTPGLAEAVPDFFSTLPERGASRTHLLPRRRVPAGPQDISTGR